MPRILFLISLMIALWVLPAHAAGVKELSQAELRQAVGLGKSISVEAALKHLNRSVPGEPVDVRAFEGAGIFYRVLVQQSSGRFVSVIIDASSGEVLPSSSSTARSVNMAARTGAASQPGGAPTNTRKSDDADEAGNNGNAGGNSNAGGKGNAGGAASNGNAGGNGNGSGNAGGNGGNGGNGNSGGNGNGNGKK